VDIEKNLILIAPGNRGDVQPYIPLGKWLKDAGHPARIVTNQNYEALVQSHGIEFWPVGGNLQDIIQQLKNDNNYLKN